MCQEMTELKSGLFSCEGKYTFSIIILQVPLMASDLGIATTCKLWVFLSFCCPFKKLEAFCKQREENAISHYSLRQANITRLLHSEV